MTLLRGLAWDHRRCWGPLEASVAPYRALHPGQEIEWHRRSLYDFGEGAIDSVLSSYDLLVFDHPFIGEISRGALMVPFDASLSDAARDGFARDSVGKSWQSYAMDGSQWALPIDAACQVASCRPDLMQRYGALPRSHREVVELGRRLRNDGKWLGLPSIPTDAMCLLLTFSTPSADGDEFISAETLDRVVGELRELAALAHPQSGEWNPIRCYDHMISHDDVVYTPFAFGYVNYATGCDGHPLAFADIPTPSCTGALLGGAGIGVSARSRNRQAAIEYALFLCSANYQRGDYVRAGGQPGSLRAWQDDGVNAMCGNFFADTLRTIKASYLRPTHSGFMTFFRETGPRMAAAIAGDMTPGALSEWLNRRYRETLPMGRGGAT